MICGIGTLAARICLNTVACGSAASCSSTECRYIGFTRNNPPAADSRAGKALTQTLAGSYLPSAVCWILVLDNSMTGQHLRSCVCNAGLQELAGSGFMPTRRIPHARHSFVPTRAVVPHHQPVEDLRMAVVRRFILVLVVGLVCTARLG